MKKTSKKEFICEQDRIMAAFAKVNLREAVDPIVRGKIVEDEDIYNKVQHLLDCPDMEHAHQFLLDVDFEDLTPEVKQKIDDLYQLAVSQGYIDSGASAAEESDEVSTDTAALNPQVQVTDVSGGFENDVPNPTAAAMKDPTQVAQTNLATCAFTLFYSAMKDGQIKTGECYSNATTLENAKIDAVQKLQRLGYTAVEIIAAEECDPNAKGCDEQQPDEFGEPINDVADTAAPVEEPADEPSDETEVDVDVDDDEETDDFEEDDDTVGEAEEKADNEPKDDVEDEEEPEEEEPADDEKELSRSEKLDLFKRYLEEFKGLLQKMKAETYADMELADRAKFYDEMSKIWNGKPDPSQFMTDDNVKQIEHMKIKISK